MMKVESYQPGVAGVNLPEVTRKEPVVPAGAERARSEHGWAEGLALPPQDCDVSPVSPSGREVLLVCCFLPLRTPSCTDILKTTAIVSFFPHSLHGPAVASSFPCSLLEPLPGVPLGLTQEGREPPHWSQCWPLLWVPPLTSGAFPHSPDCWSQSRTNCWWGCIIAPNTDHLTSHIPARGHQINLKKSEKY